jgi:uncharacterized membrane protein YgaE (UPF0421/DUF939 family)
MDNVKFATTPVLDFNADSKQLTEAKSIHRRMRAKMDKMMQSVASCHEEMESQLHASKDQFEELMSKELGSLRDIDRQCNTKILSISLAHLQSVNKERFAIM